MPVCPPGGLSPFRRCSGPGPARPTRPCAWCARPRTLWRPSAARRCADHDGRAAQRSLRLARPPGGGSRRPWLAAGPASRKSSFTPAWLRKPSGIGLRRWIDSGIRLTSDHPEQQRAYFTLASPESRAMLQRERDGTLFADVERRLVLDVLEEIRHRQELHPLDRVRDERAEVVAPLLAVGHDVDPGILLLLQGEERRLLDAVLEVLRAALARVEQPRRPRRTPASPPARSAARAGSPSAPRPWPRH